MPNLSETISFEMNVFPPPILGRSAVPKPYEGALRYEELCCVPSIERRLGAQVADMFAAPSLLGLVLRMGPRDS